MPTIRWFEKRLAELGTHKALLRVAEPDGPTRQASGER
jgi:hypothetical protein